MNMADIIVLLIVAVLMVFACKGAIKHFKGEGSCCGGGGSVSSSNKTLSGEVLGKKVLKISGMHCENCASKVQNAINAIDGASAQVDLENQSATVTYDREIKDKVIIKAVEKAGYKVLAIA
ncbi:MAG: heavy-metal-associated domain-containing protein [Erysipelotrichaceae bacterium]|nr:heavy-metal-associated domain-containing protein [Erysipelotrichaceae bacterium]